MQGLTSENEKLTLTHFLQKFAFFKKKGINTGVEQPRVYCDTSNYKFINELRTLQRKLRRYFPALESTQYREFG